MDFPHLGNGQFPYIDNLDAYSWQNDFNYRRWGRNVKIKPMAVGIDRRNVPGFASPKERDAWFDAQPGATATLASAINVLPGHEVALPLPFDQVARCNYLMVEFPVMTDAGQPIDYERTDGVRRYYYYLRNMEYRAPNTTAAIVELDWWTTYEPYTDVRYLMLARGHAPVSASDADAFLRDPQGNGRYLLAPDANYGEAHVSASIHAAQLDGGELWAVLAYTADARVGWGAPDNGWRVPARHIDTVQGIPGVAALGMAAGDLWGFMEASDAQVPQFKQTVKGLYLVPAQLLWKGRSFTFCGTSCWEVGAYQKAFPIVDLGKADFGYPSDIAHLAKLYTYPYAQLEVTYGDGSVSLINVEDTSGKLELQAAASLAWPGVGVDAYVSGIGGKVRKALTFKRLDSSSTYAAEGRWYETAKRWDLPSYLVVQDAATDYSWSTYYDRRQAKASLDAAYASSTASAQAAYSNALDSADTGKANADASADTSVTNTANTGNVQKANNDLSIANATYITNENNACASTITANGITTNTAYVNADQDMQRAMIETDNKATAATTVSNAAGNIVSGFMSGGIPGAAAGLLSGVVAGVNAAVAINASNEKVQATLTNAWTKNSRGADNSTKATNAQVTASSANNRTSNQTADAQVANSIAGANRNAANSASTARANATRSQTTSKGNAKRSYDAALANAGRSRDVAQGAIDNGIAQAALRKPIEYGAATSTVADTVQPMAAYVSVVTQPPGSIRQAADQFLRYGYALNQQWEVTGWNLMPKFTYWEATEVWLDSDARVTQEAEDAIVGMLLDGVTVWRDPSEIGKVGIYGNR